MGIKTKLRWPTIDRDLFFERIEFLGVKGETAARIAMRVQVALLSFVRTCSIVFCLVVEVWIYASFTIVEFFFVFKSIIKIVISYSGYRSTLIIISR